MEGSVFLHITKLKLLPLSLLARSDQCRFLFQFHELGHYAYEGDLRKTCVREFEVKENDDPLRRPLWSGL